jgi:hypothetical protein
MEVGITEEKFSLIQNSLLDFKLKSIWATWDGYGGLDFEFNPNIGDLIIQKTVSETLREVIYELGIGWNFLLKTHLLNASEICFEYIEIRNLSDIGEITFENSDFLTSDVLNYILTNHNLNMEECECIITYSQIGFSFGDTTSDFYFSSKGEFTSQGNFSFTILNDEDTRDITCEALEKMVGRAVHNYIIDNCSMRLNYFDYNFDFMDGQLNNISLSLSPETITIKKLN